MRAASAFAVDSAADSSSDFGRQTETNLPRERRKDLLFLVGFLFSTAEGREGRGGRTIERPGLRVASSTCESSYYVADNIARSVTVATTESHVFAFSFKLRELKRLDTEDLERLWKRDRQ